MLSRISLVVAILAGLGVGALSFIKVKEDIVTLQTNLKTEKDGRAKAEADLRTTSAKLKKSEADLKQTQSDLATSNEEKTRAQGEAAAATRKAAQLTDELAKTRTELGDAQAEVARYRASGMTAETALVANQTIKDLRAALAGAQDENKLLGKKIVNLKYELAKYQTGDIPVVELPANLKGKVVVADPKWEFVILDVGEDQGVLKDGELLVSRNGQLVCKVIVHTVEKGRSIANVMPGWKIGEVMEGDVVIPAHPSS